MTLITGAAIVAMRLRLWTGVPEVTHARVLSKMSEDCCLVVLLQNVCLISNALLQLLPLRICHW